MSHVTFAITGYRAVGFLSVISTEIKTALTASGGKGQKDFYRPILPIMSCGIISLSQNVLGAFFSPSQLLRRNPSIIFPGEASFSLQACSELMARVVSFFIP